MCVCLCVSLCVSVFAVRGHVRVHVAVSSPLLSLLYLELLGADAPGPRRTVLVPRGAYASGGVRHNVVFTAAVRVPVVGEDPCATVREELDRTKAQLARANANLNAALDELSVLREVHSDVLVERDDWKERCVQHEKTIVELNTTIAKLRAELDAMEKKLADVVAELKRKDAILAVGAWFELAREQVLDDYKLTYTEGRSGREWGALNHMIFQKGTDKKKADFWKRIRRLFDLSESEWNLVIALYDDKRCGVAHARPPAPYTQTLLEYIPSPYSADVSVFERLVENSNEREQEEEQKVLQRFLQDENTEEED
jgi:hypothetical protein